jgi:orotate phosphoribosyltransferase
MTLMRKIKMLFRSDIKFYARRGVMLKRLIEIILEKSFDLHDTPDIQLASGKFSNFYIDCKPTTLDPEGKYLIANLIFDKISDIGINAIGGLSTGADPISDAVSLFSFFEKKPIKAFYVRKEIKDHGTKKKIEGDVQKGSRVVIVDDVITTGSSTIQAIESARQEGLEVVKVIVLVDREEGGRAEILKLVSDFESIVTKQSLMEVFNARYRKKRTASRQPLATYQTM